MKMFLKFLTFCLMTLIWQMTFLSDDFVLTNVLNDISNFETGQISVQNNSQTVVVTNTPTLNTFRIPGIQSTSGLTISSINNCTVNFNFHQ